MSDWAALVAFFSKAIPVENDWLGASVREDLDESSQHRDTVITPPCLMTR
jgi:hypothetical protein